MNLAEVKKSENLNDVLAKRLEKAKEAEASAINLRREIEQEILDICGVEREGSTTFNGEQYKLTTIGKINRTIDQKELIAIWPALPDEAKEAIRYKPEIINKEFDALKKHNKPAWQALCECVTEKEAKPSVTFSLIKTTK